MCVCAYSRIHTDAKKLHKKKSKEMIKKEFRMIDVGWVGRGRKVVPNSRK